MLSDQIATVTERMHLASWLIGLRAPDWQSAGTRKVLTYDAAR